jgi:hypothetical protein
VNYRRLPVIVVIFVVTPAISSFARSSHSSSSLGDFGAILGIGVALLVGVASAVINASRKPKPVSQEELAKQKAEVMDFLNKINTEKFVPPDTPLILAREEVPWLHEASTLIEARATRVYAGGGTRVEGVYIGGGQSGSVQGLKEVDTGTLTLTTNRLVFTGSMESRVANIKDIVSVQNFADAIQISTARKAKRQVYLVRNPLLWVALIRTVISGGTRIELSCPRCDQIVTAEQRSCPNCNAQLEIPHSIAVKLSEQRSSLTK